MNTNKIISLLIVLILISGCANSKFSKKYNKPFKHNTPLIKDDIKSEGKAEIAKTLELGPKPVDGDTRKLGKRKKITSEQNKNYLIIPEEEKEDMMSLYNFKLAGLISGVDYSYISLVDSGGEVITLSLGQNLGKIKLVDLRLNEAIFQREDKSYIIIDFNNQIRESNEY